MVILSLAINPMMVNASRFIFGPDKTIIDGRTNASAVKPGDTIYLTASVRQFLIMRNLHGSQSGPILVQNDGGQVIFNNYNYGVKFDTCSWIKMQGVAATGSYGFLISNINAGISIGGLSTCIEVAGFEIMNAAWTGIVAKTDPDCSFLSTRGHYVMRNISIHDNYLHDIANEGMYIGHSYYNGYTIQCNGKDTIVYPHLIRGLKVYNNKVESTGWDGIQVSSSDSACQVNNNYIYHDSQAELFGQMSGFLLGGGSSCDCYSNFIKDGKGDGIDELGLGGNYIYNNLIVRPGQSLSGASGKHGIFIGMQSPAAGKGYHLVFNTIISPKTNGIDFRSTAAVNSEASDNIITSPGSGGSYIKTASGTSLAQLDNLLVATTAEVKFINPSADNYDLQPSSPAVNKASSVTGLVLNSDILGRWRPWPWKYDIGAYECHDSSLLSIEEKKINETIHLIKCYLSKNSLIVSLELDVNNLLTIDLFSLAGKHVASLDNSIRGPGACIIEKNVGRLEDACYICIIRFAGNTISVKLAGVSNPKN